MAENESVVKSVLRMNRLTFPGGKEVSVEDADVVVFVGPNNSGKSRALIDIEGPITKHNHQPLVVLGIGHRLSGWDDAQAWLGRVCETVEHRGNTALRSVSGSRDRVEVASAKTAWERASSGELRGVDFIRHSLVVRLDANGRLNLVHNPPRLDNAPK